MESKVHVLFVDLAKETTTNSGGGAFKNQDKSQLIYSTFDRNIPQIDRHYSDMLAGT